MSISRVSDLLDMYQDRYRKTDVFGERRDGHWIGCSSNDFVRLVNEISLGLLELGVCKGDKIGIMSANWPEWNCVDFVKMQFGAVTVPLDRRSVVMGKERSVRVDMRVSRNK